jgi:4-amino-4-deoxy-L-arabinose transferase-like glycosyltransferase
MTPLAARTAGARLKRRILLFLAFAALALATRAVVLGAGIVDLDEAAYATIARGMLHGQALYAQVADHKPPLVFAWFALAQGMMLGPSMLSVRLLTYLLLPPLTALGMSAFFDHDRRGVIAGVTWLVYGAAFVGHDMLAVNCESLMMLPLVWSVVILRRPEDARRALRLLLAGALVGIATLFKYHAALWLPIGIVGAWGVSSSPPARVRGALRASLALGTGFARPLLSAYALFAVRGTDPDFIYWNLTHNFSYVAATVGLRTAMERAASSVLPFLLVTAPLWAGVWRLRAEPLDSHRRWLVLTALALAGLGVVPGERFYPHYLVPLYVPLAWGAAPWLAVHLRRPLSWPGRLFVGWTAAVLAGFTIATAVLLHRPDVYSERRPVFRAVAAEIHRRACRPDGPMFVWGFAPQFYYEADLPPASRFIFVGWTLVGHVSGGHTDPRVIRQDHWDWLMHDLHRTPPDFIVDASAAGLSRWNTSVDEFPRFASLLARRYRRVARLDGAILWQRKGCRSPGAGLARP